MNKFADKSFNIIFLFSYSLHISLQSDPDRQVFSMALFQRQQIGLEKTGRSVSIPRDPRAKLMYYIDCLCTVIDIDDGDLSRLRDFRNYQLTTRETDQLLAIAAMLDPRPLIGKVLFQEDSMCGDSKNQFYNLNQVNRHLAVVGSLVIGGERRRTTKIMCFKMSWLNDNYLEPFREVLLRRREEQARARQQTELCIIL